MDDFCKDRAAAVLWRHLICRGIGIFGILELNRAAAGIFRGSVPVAVVSVSAGDQPGTGGIFFCGFCDYADPGSLCIFTGAGISGAGDCSICDEGVRRRWICGKNKDGSGLPLDFFWHLCCCVP